MAVSRGKAFENKFKEDFLKTFPNDFVMRIPDQVSRRKATSRNIADFIAYKKPYMFIVECKTSNEGTVNFSNIPQYNRLTPYDNIEGVFIYIIAWFVKHGRVMAVPLKEMTKMIADGKKSLNVKMLDSGEYKVFEIPSVRKRVNLDCDYTILVDKANEVTASGS